MEIFLRKRKKESDNNVVNVTKISQKMKKILYYEKRRFILIKRKYFNLENFAFL